MLKVESDALTFCQTLIGLTCQARTQHVVHLNNRLALQVLPNGEVDLAVGGVGVDAEV